VLRYQPIIHLDSGSVSGAEALLRYDDPHDGLIPPSDFLTVAEESGLIVPIGTWVADEASQQAARWRAAAGDEFFTSINVSARQLFHPSLIDTLRERLDREALPGGSVLLEITESVLIEAAGATVRTLDRLRTVGSRLGIDDFGTGYSSLTYLRRFPIDVVKIDRSFVAGVDSNPEDAAIVSAMIGLADALNLATVAEGVETEGQLTTLKNMGCRYAQGFHLARPEPPEALSERLSRERSTS